MSMNRRFKKNLTRLCKTAGIPETHKLVVGCAFSEKVANENRNAILSTPCGTGKTTFAMNRALTYGSRKAPVMLVFATREEAAECYALLNSLRHGEVGLALGFSADECTNPAKSSTSGNKRKNLCRQCKARFKCTYYCSPKAMRMPIVITTHANFIQICISSATKLAKFEVIVDEDLSNFYTASFSFEELSMLHGYLHTEGFPKLLASVFPALFDIQGKPCEPKSEARDATLLSMIPAQEEMKLLQRHFHSWIKKRSDSRVISLLSKFIFFYRVGASHAGKYAVITDTAGIIAMRHRVNLQALNCRRFLLLDATASLSLNRFSSDTKIFTCQSLWKFMTAKAYLNIVPANPTKSKREQNLPQMLAMPLPSGPARIMITENNDGAFYTKRIEDFIQVNYPAYCGATIIPRGKLRGTNEARACEVVIMLAGLFSGVSMAILSAALVAGRTIHANEVWNNDGSLIMNNGRFKCKELQEVFMKSCIADIYQGLFRSALRDDKSVTAVLALPDVNWVRELSQLMNIEVINVAGNAKAAIRMKGFSKLLNMAAGQAITKAEAAATLGFNTYKANKANIRSLLEQHFTEEEQTFTRNKALGASPAGLISIA